MESNRFVAPLDDLYLTTELEHGQLPLFLEKAISVAELPTQQDMLLLGTLTTASFALPHVRILHGNPQHSYSPRPNDPGCSSACGRKRGVELHAPTHYAH